MAEQRTPCLIRYLAINAGVGIFFGWMITIAILWMDLSGIRTMALRSQDGWLAITMLFGGMTITWGSLAAGTAIFSLPRDPQDNGDFGSGFSARLASLFNHRQRQVAPIRVRSRRH